MKIETPRLIIRPFREKDADALYRIKTDPRVMEYCPDFLDVDAKREDMPDYIRTFRKLETLAADDDGLLRGSLHVEGRGYPDEVGLFLIALHNHLYTVGNLLLVLEHPTVL